ncbi:MAG: DNA repair protein RecN [Nitrospinota bacterium]
MEIPSEPKDSFCMLTELIVENFGIVDRAKIQFKSGFTALTGETGAGKSLVVEAAQLVLGERATQNVVQTGKLETIISAAFDITNNSEVLKILANEGFNTNLEDQPLILKRIIQKEGKNRSYINGEMATVLQLKKVGLALVDIHGQNETQTLFNTKSHMELLDQFIGVNQLFTKYQKIFAKYKNALKKFNSFNEKKSEIERNIVTLKYQINEIESANLSIGLDHTLEAEQKRLGNLKELLEFTNLIEQILEQGEYPVVDSINRVKILFDKMSQIDPTVESASRPFSELLLMMDETLLELRSYGESLAIEPDRLIEVEERLSGIYDLKRKYGQTLEEVLEFYDRAKKELDHLEFDSSNLEQLELDLIKFGRAAAKLAIELDQKRQQGAINYAGKIQKELASLDIDKARIEFQFTYQDDEQSFAIKDNRPLKMSENGIGAAEMLFSANPGAMLRPLSKIGSGGEISRAMLAIKSLLADYQQGSTIIFDEIDSGVGGATGDKIGTKLKELAKNRSVICVTHLAQVARFADNHLVVEKVASKDRTKVTIKELEYDDRVKELARMVAGKKAKEAALHWAREVLK